MFDTVIFNSILDSDIDIALLNGRECFATHIQYDEILATPDATRRSQLEEVFSLIPQLTQLPTESFVIGVSRLGESRLSDGILYSKMRSRLNEVNKRKRNNLQDILIAETAMKTNITLVTHDKDLFAIITEFGGAACNLWCVLKSS